MKKIYTILALCLAWAATANAQNFPVLLIGSDPSAAALGASPVGRNATAFAADNNAAAMSLSSNRFDVAAGYQMWQPGTADGMILGFGTYYRIDDKMAIGLGGKYLKDRETFITSAVGAVTGSFVPSDMTFNAGFSYSFVEGLSAGVNIKFLSSTLSHEASGTAFGADVTVAYRKDGLSAGAGVYNLGSSLKYSKSAYALPGTVKAGASYALGVGGTSVITPSAEVDYLFSGGLMAGLGAEYAFKDMVFVRAGYHYGDAEKAIPSYGALGLGAKFTGAHLDLSYILADNPLGGTLSISLGYSF